jgi:hypothetical protein
MQSTTRALKNRAPLWVWALLLGLVIIVAVLATLHFVGIVDLTFLGDWFMGAFSWASLSIINGGLLFAGIFIFGAACFWFYKAYIVGVKISNTQGQQQGYTPVPTYPTQQPQNGSETKIS